MALLSGAFLAEMAWDPARCVLAPPNGHRLVVRPVCRVGGCSTTATNARKICLSCQRRLRIAGLGDDEIGVLPAPDEPTRLAVSAPFSNGPCEVAACVRQRRHPDGLCAHDRRPDDTGPGRSQQHHDRPRYNGPDAGR